MAIYWGNLTVLDSVALTESLLAIYWGDLMVLDLVALTAARTGWHWEPGGCLLFSLEMGSVLSTVHYP